MSTGTNAAGGGLGLDVGSIDALILCGGLGTRLQPIVSDRPKGLAEVSGRPFLDILVEELVAQGLRRIILCAGFQSDQIIAHFAQRREAEFVFSVEPRPLGTAGAVRNALSHVQSDPFLVVNGDSYCKVDYDELCRLHGSVASLLTIVVTSDRGRDDVGTISVAPDGRVRSFAEKPDRREAEATYVNAGIYVMQRSLIAPLPAGTALSLERDVFPGAVRAGRCHAKAVTSKLIDIGTPDRYRAAQSTLR